MASATQDSNLFVGTKLYFLERSATSTIAALQTSSFCYGGTIINNDSTRGKRRVGCKHLISNKREWNNCFIENNHKILVDLADFALQEQLEDNLMASFFLGHGIMAHIPWPRSQSNRLIQFLIIPFI